MKNLKSKMARYRICFACTLPSEPGCGCPDNDFYAEQGFEGSAEGAIKMAERTSWERYRGDFQWWIIEDPSIKLYLEVPVKKPEKRLYTPQKLSDELKKSNNVIHHNSKEDLTSILSEPTYTEIAIEFNLGREFHCIDFNLYNNGLLVDRGKQKPGSSNKPHVVTKSLFSVEEMIYKLNLVYGKKVSHVLRIDRYTKFHTKEFAEQSPLKMDTYEFHINDELMTKYLKKHKDFSDEEEQRFRDMCERLETRGTTL